MSVIIVVAYSGFRFFHCLCYFREFGVFRIHVSVPVLLAGVFLPWMAAPFSRNQIEETFFSFLSSSGEFFMLWYKTPHPPYYWCL